MPRAARKPTMPPAMARVSGIVPVAGPLTDAQLRATPVPITGNLSVTAAPGAATEATLALIKAKTDNLDVPLSTRAVGGLTDTQLRATPVPISGVVGISGSVAAVTGGLSDTQLRAAPVPVSGTVVTGGLTDAQLRAAAVPVSGTVTASGPLTDAQLRAGAVPVSGPLTDVQLRATPVPVSLPALAKGTQGATGVSVQALHDAGRNQTAYFTAAPIAATAAEVLQALTGYKGGAAVAPTTTPAVVTAGKTFRVTAIVVTFQSLATITAAIVRLRCNLTGVAALASPLVAAWVIGSSAAAAGVTTTLVIPLDGGLEFPAGAGLAIGVLGISATGVAAASGFVSVALHGYEY